MQWVMDERKMGNQTRNGNGNINSHQWLLAVGAIGKNPFGQITFVGKENICHLGPALRWPRLLNETASRIPCLLAAGSFILQGSSKFFKCLATCVENYFY